MGAAQIVFLVGLASLIVAMALRKNVMIPAVLATFATALAYSGSVPNAIMSVFRATITSGTALFEIFIVIAAVTSMLAAMRAIGSDEVMVRPVSRWMVNGRVAYIVLFVFTYFLSLFFWPTPALALIGAVLLPAAIKVGLPPLGAAVVLAISGQGMSIASDYVIGLAPSISASGAGVPADDIADRALVISLIVGITAAVLAYFLTVRRRMRTDAVPGTDPIGGTGHPPGGVGGTPAGPAAGFAPSPEVAVSPTATDVLDEELPGFEDDGTRITDRPTLTRAWAIGVPAAFVAVLVYMLAGRFTDLVPWEDGAGASLVGGTAIILMALVTVTSRRSDALEFCATHFIDGLSYAFKAMGIILPVAGFVYIGIPDYSGAILGLDDDTTGPAFLFDTVERVQPYIPDNGVFVALSMLFIGMAVGLDGSGWAGLPLTGGLAAALAPQSGMDTATLAAIAQNGATWTGGGTLVIWSSLVVVAGFCRIPVAELVRHLVVPVMAGLLLATGAAVVIW
ncbi:permease [Rhodococcus opacus]|uniref:permease n=1 Tax=Rhodococcus opacus TaxID=37919 RepID=UPI0024B87F40|nr:permease [Rhodococcus opacus]MDJ0415585.1 permease [Rhodococcus opacus]